MMNKSNAQRFLDFAPWARTFDRNDNLIPGYFTTVLGEVWEMHFNPFRDKEVPLGWCELLPELTELRRVELDGSPIDRERFGKMFGLSALTALSIDFTGDFSQSDFAPFSTFNQLASLQVGLEASASAAHCFQALADCPSLTKLGVNCHATLDEAVCEGLAGLTQVEELSIHWPYPAITGEFPFASLRARSISLGLPIGDDNTDQIGSTTAATLLLSRSHVGDETVRRLASAETIRVLHLHDTQVTEIGLATLGGSKIQNLNYSHQDQPITMETVRAIAQMPCLKTLGLKPTTTAIEQAARKLMPDCEINFDGY